MFVVIIVCRQVEVSATSLSLVQRSPTDCGTSLCVIMKSSIIRRPWHTRGTLAPWEENIGWKVQIMKPFFTYLSNLLHFCLLRSKYSPQRLFANILIVSCAIHSRDYCHIHMQQERTYNCGALLMIVKSTKTCQPIILNLYKAALKIQQKSVINSWKGLSILCRYKRV